MKPDYARLAREIGEFVQDAVVAMVAAQLKFDRKVLKRYLGIETPFYRRWHRSHVKRVQAALDREHWGKWETSF